MKTLQEMLDSAGLMRVRSEILQEALPSVRLRAHRVETEQLEQDTTRFGGLPNLPRGWAWPERNGFDLPFIAQINLFEVTAYDVKHLLPDGGMLYFFFDIDAFFKEARPRDQTLWRVLHSPLTSLQHTTVTEVDTLVKVYPTNAVSYALEMTLPDYSQYDTTSIQRLGLSEPLTDDEEKAYHKVQAQLAGIEPQYHIPIHRLLGHPDTVQWDMHRNLPGAPTDWQLLFQVDSDAALDTNWGDTGRIYYWIRLSDLMKKDFSRVRLILQST